MRFRYDASLNVIGVINTMSSLPEIGATGSPGKTKIKYPGFDGLTMSIIVSAYSIGQRG